MRTAEYFLEKQRQFEQQKRQSLIEQARQESKLLRKLEEEREGMRRDGLLLFRLWSIADRVLTALEQQRKEYEPKDPDAPWDEKFCDAIRKIPEIRRLCDDLWFAWMNVDRPEFWTWI